MGSGARVFGVGVVGYVAAGSRVGLGLVGRPARLEGRRVGARVGAASAATQAGVVGIAGGFVFRRTLGRVGRRQVCFEILSAVTLV